MSETCFVETLLRWREDATPVDEEFVDALLSKLSRRIKQHQKLLEETQAEFDHLYEQHEEEKQEALLHRLDGLERQSRIRMSHGFVYASIEHIYGPWDDYDSLIADSEYDMTRWVIDKPGGKTEPYRLRRLSMYPMILAGTNRMGFARIGKTRITYIRKSLKWTNRRFEIGGKTFDVTITFPKTDTKTRNIVVKLTHSYLGSCEAAFLFTGDAFRLVRKRYFKDPYSSDEHDSFVVELDNAFFGSSKELAAFFGRFFTSFTYAQLGRDNKNVRDFLKGERFRLSVIQFQYNPVLVIKKQW